MKQAPCFHCGSWTFGVVGGLPVCEKTLCQSHAMTDDRPERREPHRLGPPSVAYSAVSDRPPSPVRDGRPIRQSREVAKGDPNKPGRASVESDPRWGPKARWFNGVPKGFERVKVTTEKTPAADAKLCKRLGISLETLKARRKAKRDRERLALETEKSEFGIESRLIRGRSKRGRKLRG